MKTLATINGYELNIDEGQYIIYTVNTIPELKKDGTPNKHAGETARTNPRYYGRLERAVARLCELVADNLCEDLHSWLECYQQASDKLIKALGK